jgi:membrane-associated protein
MPHFLNAIAASPWVLALVFLVAGLDAILPFMPSESTVVACGVAAANTGRPLLSLLIIVSAAGAYAGDQLSFRIGRNLPARVTRPRFVRRLLQRRGGLVIVFARYLPGARSATALGAGLVGYPALRFHWYTAAGVLLWATESALLGYLGGSLFEDRPLFGLLLGLGGALLITGIAYAVGRSTDEASGAGAEQEFRG